MFSRKWTVTALLLAVAGGIVYAAGVGLFVPSPGAGAPEARAISPEVTRERTGRIKSAASTIGVSSPKQILFGDLHVNTTFSFDAFQLSLPMSGGEAAPKISAYMYWFCRVVAEIAREARKIFGAP